MVKIVILNKGCINMLRRNDKQETYYKKKDMFKCKMIYFMVLLICVIIFLLKQAISQTVDCYSTLEAWKLDKSLRQFMSTHNCYCPSPTSSPVCVPISNYPSLPSPQPTPGLSYPQQMQLQMFQSIMAPMFGALGSMINQSLKNLFMPQENYSNFQRQQEETKRKALEAWQKHMKEAEEQAKKEEEERKKAGQELLSQVRIGSGPLGSYTIIGPKASERETLSQIDWDNPRPQSTSLMKTPGSAKEQLLRTAYFAKMAETFLQSGDLEAARFYAGLAFEGDAISPRPINYTPPKELVEAMDSKKAIELNDKLTQLARFYKLAIPQFERLQFVYTELEEVKTKKEGSKKKIEELEKQIEELRVQKQTLIEISENKTSSETDELLAQALALKQKAENEYQEALKNEEKLLQQKQEIENNLNKLKNQFLPQNSPGGIEHDTF
jgi:hypothetical protein